MSLSKYRIYRTDPLNLRIERVTEHITANGNMYVIDFNDCVAETNEDDVANYYRNHESRGRILYGILELNDEGEYI